jgi:hypothetical protein
LHKIVLENIQNYPLMYLSLPTSIFYDRLDGMNNAYGINFKMHCLLRYCDTNHTRNGYRVVVVIKSNNSIEWLDKLTSILNENSLIFRRI